MESLNIIVEIDNEGIRLDKYLALVQDDLTRSKIQTLIKNKDVLVNGNEVSSSYKVKVDDEIVVNLPKITPMNVIAEEIPLDIRYEDDDLVVVNKPKGWLFILQWVIMMVHLLMLCYITLRNYLIQMIILGLV